MSLLESPFISLEQFLSKSMNSKAQASFKEFLKLWQSSEYLQLLIKQIVESEHLGETYSKSILEKNANHSLRHKEPFSQNKVIRRLINRNVMSPLKIEGQLQRAYGGLSQKELLELMERYRAGKRNLGIYMLVRAWKAYSSCPKDTYNIRLEQITVEYFARAIGENRADFFKEIADTIKFLKEGEYEADGNWNHDPGSWWQFHLLLYVLEHPKEKYAMREFVKHFRQEVGENEMPTPKTIRSFCRSHGIALDSRPGAPKKSETSMR